MPPPEAGQRGAELLREYQAQFGPPPPDAVLLAGRRVQGIGVDLFGARLAAASTVGQRGVAAQFYQQIVSQPLPPEPFTIWTLHSGERLIAVAPGWWHQDTPLLLEAALAPETAPGRVLDPHSQSAVRLALFSARLDFYALDPQRRPVEPPGSALAFALAHAGSPELRALQAAGFQTLD